ncbi:centrosomal protein of 162 kDa isoform X1 [Anguilla rostrata]|uniref:centrosomal protein of 162 kDa isoform X1 n=1 Tax=Anguilla rostrata TaxID=7938 RepID=UPI0030CB7572
MLLFLRAGAPPHPALPRPTLFLLLAERTGRRKFIKVRKPKEGAFPSDPVGQEDSSRPGGSPPQAPVEPTPKPRSRALDKFSQLENLHKAKRASDDAPGQRRQEDADKQAAHDALRQGSPEQEEPCGVRGQISPKQEDSHDASGQLSPDQDSHNTPEKTSISDSQGNGDGLLASGKTFRKSLRKSQPIQEEDEEQLPAMHQREEELEEGAAEQVLFSRDSLEPEESIMASGPGVDGFGKGLDTLDEEEEKARFFSALERGASSTIDYSRLNRELDSALSTPAHTLRKADDVRSEEEHRAERVRDSRSSPASPNYSEDFEDEVSPKEAQDEEHNIPSMLAKVSLHDSLDSMGGAQQPEANEEAGREDWAGPVETEAAGAAQSYGQSGVSEMEALQEAYREISGSVDEVEGHGRGLSPAGSARIPNRRTPSPEHPPGMAKNTMTTGSDLPTAEELMQRMGLESDSTRGFSLQPVSYHAGSQKDSQTSVGETRGSAPTDAPDEGHRRVQEEAERLMQYEEDSPRASSPPPSKDRKQKSAVWSPVSSPSSWRKSAKNKRASDRPSPTATKTSGPSRTGPTAKPFPLPQRKPLTQGPKKSLKPGPLKQDGAGAQSNAGMKVSSELIASVQSFADYLQHQMERSGCQDNGELRRHSERKKDEAGGVRTPGSPQRESEVAPTRRSEDVQECRSSERHPVALMELQLERKEAELRAREEELQLAHGKEVIALKQENYILQSKLRSMEEASRKRKWSFGEASDPVTEEKLKLIEKEVKEQETLIQGYHQENEKLYQQVKALQAQSKQSEEAMFQENQRLLSELAAAKEQINRKSVQRIVGRDSEMDPSHNLTDLLAQLQAAQKAEARLMEETRRLRQEKQGLEVDLEMIKKERDQARAQVTYTSGDLNFEMRVQLEEHKSEVSALKKRLQWYAENQELLDKDAARLRAATAETQKLKEQVERLKMEVGRRDGMQQKKNERMGDAKRIQDLERQVKEMEKILMRRNPNSLPALIFAAASAGGGGAPESPQTVALLERRIRRLEAELEGRDEEAKRSLRAMEQQFQRIKMQYEERISELEQQLAQSSPVLQGDGSSSPQGSQSKAQLLQAELESEREAGQARERSLQAELAALRERLSQAGLGDGSSHSPARLDRQAEAAQSARVQQLTKELASKSRSVQELSRTVERLQRERRTLLSAPAPAPAGRPGEGRRPGAQGRGRGAGAGAEAQTFPPTLDEKDYQPTAFSGSHISEVLQESQRLRARLEQQELEAEQERVSLRATAAHAEAELRRTRERAEEQLLALRSQHQKELEGLLARHALEHSASKVAELANQMSTQEIMIRHLRDQLKDLQGCREALTLSQVREETLQTQMAKLLEDLREAKEAHTPELRHFSALERKIESMELRYTQRERELQQVIAQTRLVVEAEQQKEVERWRKQAQAKGQELEAFRVELDSILDVLRELQRQGVVIPVPEASRAEPFGWGS